MVNEKETYKEAIENVLKHRIEERENDKLIEQTYMIEWANLPWYIKAVVIAGWINIILFSIGFIIGFVTA